MNNIRSGRYKVAVYLAVLTAGAVMVHGYHPYAEDAEIYLPGVEHLLNPRLFPTGREFFESHAGMTLFPNLVAAFLRITHLPLETGLFLLHVLSIFLLLFGCWRLSGVLFPSTRARWSGVCLIAALLTLPVSGTALYIMDQYLNPRNLAAFAGVFAVTSTLTRRYIWALFWIACAVSVHPLMWVFPFSFCALWIVTEKFDIRLGRRVARAAAVASVSAGAWIPFAVEGTAEYHEAAKLHAGHYIQNWQWYEWLGLLAPLFLLWCFERIARNRQWDLLARSCRVFMIYGVIYLVVALLLDLPARFERLARVQPLRSLHLEYVFLFLCMGALLGEYVLKDRIVRWLVLFVPLCFGMLLAQRQLFPGSAHVEWPEKQSRNPWAQAFVWVRGNTPVDAIFALDPEFMSLPGEDEIGFRCLAQRSRLADAVKDNGVVSMFPSLSEEWWGQVQAQNGWRSFSSDDFNRLRQTLGVSWVVLQRPEIPGVDCPYRNSDIAVCQIR